MKKWAAMIHAGWAKKNADGQKNDWSEGDQRARRKGGTGGKEESEASRNEAKDEERQKSEKKSEGAFPVVDWSSAEIVE